MTRPSTTGWFGWRSSTSSASKTFPPPRVRRTARPDLARAKITTNAEGRTTTKSTGNFTTKITKGTKRKQKKNKEGKYREVQGLIPFPLFFSPRLLSLPFPLCVLCDLGGEISGPRSQGEP